ncbi:MAG: NAD(P)-binding domain-containing protein, partial [Candidatus Peregrinibacteria bacterium]|nr:NAD(P)-binding domain-containing protein [Candidatus Peregrinibacteria bacterium]
MEKSIKKNEVKTQTTKGKPQAVQSICVIGLGYVGLPLAAAFGRTHHKVSGFDISTEKVDALKKNIDLNQELSEDELKSTQVEYSDDPKVIEQADIIIAAIPTPIDNAKKPDLSPIISASKTIGQHMKEGVIVVYESTVYP